MEYQLINEFTQMTISIDLFHNLLFLAERFDWEAKGRQKPKETPNNDDNESRTFDYQIDHATVCAEDANNLSQSLEKAMDAIESQLENSPDIEYYINCVNKDSRYYQFHDTINSLIAFFKQGHFRYSTFRNDEMLDDIPF